ATTGLGGLCQDLAALSDRIAGEAEEQDAASARGDRREPGPSPAPAPSETDDGSTYLHRDAPWVPDWLEGPLEGAASDLAGVVSEGIGRGVDAGMGGIAWAAGRLRLDTDGLEQIRGDLGHLGGLLGDWATGERADLTSANDEARREVFGRTEPASYDREASGQIRIQAVRTGGGQEAYIVHAPPTAGAGIAHPHSWGAQGNSAGWDSNLRS